MKIIWMNKFFFSSRFCQVNIWPANVDICSTFYSCGFSCITEPYWPHPIFLVLLLGEILQQFNNGSFFNKYCTSNCWLLKAKTKSEHFKAPSYCLQSRSIQSFKIHQNSIFHCKSGFFTNRQICKKITLTLFY